MMLSLGRNKCTLHVPNIFAVHATSKVRQLTRIKKGVLYKVGQVFYFLPNFRSCWLYLISLLETTAHLSHAVQCSQ